MHYNIFRAEQSTRKLKLIPRTGISHAKLVVGCAWFLGIKTRILQRTFLRALSHSAKIVVLSDRQH